MNFCKPSQNFFDYVQNQMCGGWKDGNGLCLGHWVNLKRIFRENHTYWFHLSQSSFEKIDIGKMGGFYLERDEIPTVFHLMHSLNFSLSVYSSSSINQTNPLVLYAFASLSHGFHENNFSLYSTQRGLLTSIWLFSGTKIIVR